MVSANSTAVPASDVTTASGATVSDVTVSSSDAVPIEHKYGVTEIVGRPERIVSIGYGEHEALLALGVMPIAVREWYGEFPYATWPWAQDELGDATPAVIPGDALNFEQIAALDPDLILGINSGMTAEDYGTLSAIAPTVAQPADYIDYGTPWDVAMRITGVAIGLPDEADAVVARIEALFDEARAAHPEFDGATAAVTFFFEEQPGAYASEDARSRVLTRLGFVVPPAIDDAAGDEFFVSISPEDLSLIDLDAVVWIGAGEDFMANIVGIPTRTGTRAYAEGREVFADEILSGAFSHSSPLSLEYVLEELVSELAAAVDGDPATVVPSAVVAGAIPG